MHRKSRIAVPEDTPQMQRLSKTCAASRTLAEGIRLFFEGRDEIAVHSLAAAAHGAVLDIARSRKLEFRGVLHDHPSLRPELKAAWTSLLNEPRNFFKHADKDPEGFIDFDGVLNELLLLDTVALSATVMSELPTEALVYAAWYEIAYPAFAGAFGENQVLAACRVRGIAPQDRAAFRKLCNAW